MMKSEKIEKRIKEFYYCFKNSSLNSIVASLVVLLGILFFPTGRIIFSMFKGGPFVTGPYISLVLMLLIFALYTNFFLYLFVIVLFISSAILSFIGIAMGSTGGNDVFIFFIPIIVFLAINIFIAFYTYKYKKIHL